MRYFSVLVNMAYFGNYHNKQSEGISETYVHIQLNSIHYVVIIIVRVHSFLTVCHVYDTIVHLY